MSTSFTNFRLGLDIVKSIGETKGRTERRDAAENRKRIINAATKLFEQHGVEHVSINQIAMEAQIGSATLYRRYKNKSDLCLDLIKDKIALLFEDIEEYLNENQAAPPRERLKGIISLFMSFRDKKLQLLAGVEEGALAGSHFLFSLHEIIVQLFDEMKTDEQTQPNTVFKVDMLFAALRSDSYVFQRDVRGYSSESFLEQICFTFFPEK